MPRSNTVLVLVVAHVAADRKLLSDFLSGYGCEVEAVGSIEQAAEAMGDRAPDVVLMDAALPGPHVSHFIAWMRGEQVLEDIQVVLIDGEARIAGDEEARAIGARCVLAKPCDPFVLIRHLTAAATTKGLRGRGPTRSAPRPASVSARGRDHQPLPARGRLRFDTLGLLRLGFARRPQTREAPR
jgi:CheY-like chemotaxis protein